MFVVVGVVVVVRVRVRVAVVGVDADPFNAGAVDEEYSADDDVGDQRADCRDEHDGGVDGDLFQVLQSPDGFVDHEGGDHPDHHDGTEGPDDFGTVVAVRELGVLSPLGQVETHDGNAEASEVTEHVGGVADDGQGRGHDAPDDFQHDEYHTHQTHCYHLGPHYFLRGVHALCLYFLIRPSHTHI